MALGAGSWLFLSRPKVALNGYRCWAQLPWGGIYGPAGIKIVFWARGEAIGLACDNPC